MQTFLPDPSFRKSAQILDNKRLGKQRLEAKQILQILVKELDEGVSSSRWRNHPACRLWKDHERALATYGLAMCEEWSRRGFVDNQLDYFYRLMYLLTEQDMDVRFSDLLYSAHRAALLYKNLEHYKQFGWKEKPEIKYVWK